MRSYGAGNHIDRRPLARGPVGEGSHLVRDGFSGLDPDVMRPTVDPLAFVDEAPDRDQPLAVSEDHLHEPGDLLRVRLVAEHIHHGGGVIEVAPGVEVDKVFFGRLGGRVL